MTAFNLFFVVFSFFKFRFELTGNKILVCYIVHLNSTSFSTKRSTFGTVVVCRSFVDWNTGFVWQFYSPEPVWNTAVPFRSQPDSFHIKGCDFYSFFSLLFEQAKDPLCIYKEFSRQRRAFRSWHGKLAYLGKKNRNLWGKGRSSLQKRNSNSNKKEMESAHSDSCPSFFSLRP